MRTPLKFIIIPYVLKIAMQLIMLTCRVRWHDKHYFDELQESGKGWVGCMWHNASTTSAIIMRNAAITSMVSASRDGEYVTRLAKLFGNDTIRGSSSKGSSSATRAALRLLRQGKTVALTPDGPRGPKYSVQPGILFIASMAKVPILPFHIEANRQWVLKSWDNHRFPKPFSTIHVGFGKPITIDKVLLQTQQEHVAQHLQDNMMANVERLKNAAQQ